MWMRWLPWKYIVKRLARAHGFIDPIRMYSLLQNFAQPSEVAYPMELIRAGVVFHARGLMNTKVIQQNLDWVWPYWVCRQFDPYDPSFIPRGFSITHINLSHRNWTAVGLPDTNAFPIVDPAGMVTPFYDGWSVDAWVIADDGTELLPCGKTDMQQRLIAEPNRLAVQTQSHYADMRLTCETEAVLENGKPLCKMRYTAHTPKPAWLVIGIRPYNPEGVSFIKDIVLNNDRQTWKIDGRKCLGLNQPAERHIASNYKQGDLYRNLLQRKETAAMHCKAGLATAAALYAVNADEAKSVTVSADLQCDKESQPIFPAVKVPQSWGDALAGHAQLQFPNPHYETLYNNAVHSIVLHTPYETYPGPYTYKRFWFRDAAFILHALCCANLYARAERVLDLFPSKQHVQGYFASQNGEWDSNGEALWIMKRFCELTGCPPKPQWRHAVSWGAGWIQRKRLADGQGEVHDGLFPPGFSAEHLGNNDYYYWDDFWGVAGLQAAAWLCRAYQEEPKAAHHEKEAEAFMAAIERSLERSKYIRQTKALPASPYRRMDSGAVGSINAGYPLQLWPENDPRVLATVQYLVDHCFVHGGFFQEMIHSGINAYLTLQLAQVLMRAGDLRFVDLLDAVAELASPTGQWPEAIHPRTLGGCMGDGHHVWASAEWVLFIRNMFVREEHDRLVLGAGIDERWLQPGKNLRYGPTPTPYGTITINIHPETESIDVSWEADWRGDPPLIEVRLPQYEDARLNDVQNHQHLRIERRRQEQPQEEPVS